MGKLVIYTCELCEFETRDSNEVYYLDGKILNGEDEIITSDNKKMMLCLDCLMKRKQNIKIDNETIIDEILKFNDKIYCVFKQIKNEKDEIDLLMNLGFNTKESFVKIYNKPIIDHYYPIDNEEGLYSVENRKLKEKKCKVICKVFAGIPQVEEVEILVDENDSVGFLPEERCAEILGNV